MILHRVSDSLRRQDWFTVLVEIMIVVVGVFLGIQVSNWNESQAEKRLGEYYVAQLKIDLGRDLIAMERIDAYYGAVLDSVVETERLLKSESPDPRALVVAAYRATETAFYPASRSTFDQIVFSGHLGLLPKKALNEGLIDYYSLSQADTAYDLVRDSRYRELVRSIIPLSVQIAIREGCSDVMDDTGIIVGFTASCRLDVDASTMSSVAQALLNESDVSKTLRFQYSPVSQAKTMFQNNVVGIKKSLAALGAGVDE